MNADMPRCPCDENPKLQHMKATVCHPKYFGFYDLPVVVQETLYETVMDLILHEQEMHGSLKREK